MNDLRTTLYDIEGISIMKHFYIKRGVTLTEIEVLKSYGHKVYIIRSYN